MEAHDDPGLPGETLHLASGQFPFNSHSTVYENARVVKAGPGTLYGFQGYSSRTSAQLILVFDLSAGVPANGAVPVIIIPVATASVFSAYWGKVGRRFERGIVLCNSSTGPTLTIGAADTWFDAQYI